MFPSPDGELVGKVAKHRKEINDSLAIQGFRPLTGSLWEKGVARDRAVGTIMSFPSPDGELVGKVTRRRTQTT